MAVNESLFVQEGNIFTPTAYAHGPWATHLLHGGSTGGIMAHVLEQCSPNPEMRMVRTTLDMFRPVPMTPLRIESSVLKEGRRLQMVEATIYAEEKAVARSVGIRMKKTQIAVPEKHQPIDVIPEGPEGLQEIKLSGDTQGKRLPGLNSNLEVRRLNGFDGKGEGCAWFKMPLAVVEGVENSAFVHLGVISDFGNGIAQLLLPETMGMINGDINLYLHRDPRGEWIALKSKASMSETGIGVVNTQVFDTDGLVGQCHQAVMVQTR
ncbi:MAG: thioesterase family protein [Pseudomonadales bacterium]|nr:thioesterase family protein [Pseudomonadales bacterium]